MKAEFDIQLTAKDLFRFNLRQAYTSMQGPISIIIGILFFVSAGVCAKNAEYLYLVIYILAGLLFIFYIPVTLKMRAKRTLAKNAVLAGVLHYAISEESIIASTADDQGELPWENIFKMVSNKKYLYIFSNRVNAYIIPREQLGAENYETVKKLADKKLQKFRVKMK